MTTPNHGFQSAIIAHFIYPNIWFMILACIMGMMPDLGRLFQRNPNNWNEFYVPAHEPKWYNLLIPFWNLHIVEDYFIHNQQPPFGWKKGMIFVEIVSWIPILLISYLIVKGTL